MLLIAVLLILLGNIFLIFSVLLFTAHISFKNKLSTTREVIASLKSTEHRTDVTLWRSVSKSEPRFFKNLTKAVYTFKIKKKEYKIRYMGFDQTPSQIPQSVNIICFLPFPKIAFIKQKYEYYPPLNIYCFIPLFFSLIFFIFGIIICKLCI